MNNRRLYLNALPALLALAIAIAACSDQSTLAPVPGDAPPPTASGDDAGPAADGAPPDEGGPVVIQPDTVSIIVEPKDKAQALLSAIQAAKTSVHMTMYLINDDRFIAALIALHKAGRDVKVVLNHVFPGGTGSNTGAYGQLQAGGVPVAWAPTTFTLTHEKCVVIDAAQAWIMTMNLESSSSSNREFLAVDTQAADVAEADAIFAGDFAGTSVAPSGNLLVAPVNARDKLVALIAGAKTTVDLEGEELSDYKIVDALIAARKAGLTVRVVLASDATPVPAQTTAVQQLKAGDVTVVSVGNPYIHAKALVVDGARAYVGSENFTTGSLQYNRELGVIITNPTSTALVGSTIAKDFSAGSPL